MPRALWYNLHVGTVPSGLKTCNGSTFACYRKEDVVSYAIVHCNIRGPMVYGKSAGFEVRKLV